VLTTANGAPETGVSTPVKTLVPDTAGQLIAYRKVPSTQASGTYSTPATCACPCGNGIGPRATSNSPGGRGGGAGGSMTTGPLNVVTLTSFLAGGPVGGRLPGPRQAQAGQVMVCWLPVRPLGQIGTV